MRCGGEDPSGCPRHAESRPAEDAAWSVGLPVGPGAAEECAPAPAPPRPAPLPVQYRWRRQPRIPAEGTAGPGGRRDGAGSGGHGGASHAREPAPRDAPPRRLRQRPGRVKRTGTGPGLPGTRGRPSGTATGRGHARGNCRGSRSRTCRGSRAGECCRPCRPASSRGPTVLGVAGRPTDEPRGQGGRRPLPSHERRERSPSTGFAAGAPGSRSRRWPGSTIPMSDPVATVQP